MALTKKYETVTTVLSDGQLQVLTVTKIMEDGLELSRANHRHVVDVGDDTTNEDQIVKDIAFSVHTAERITDRAIVKAAERP